jgi:maltose alpha-D-glucosyltransferase / alpha-amylase
VVDVGDDDIDLLALDVRGNGYRWLRLNHTPWDQAAPR